MGEIKTNDDSGQENLSIAPKLSPLEIMLGKIDVLAMVQPDQETMAKEGLIQEKVGELMKNARPKELSLVTGATNPGFIHPESNIIRNYMVDPLNLNDNGVYETLLDTFLEFKHSPDWKDIETRRMTLPAVNRAIGKYFGNHYGTRSTESKNQQFYLNHTDASSETIGVSELKGKGFAVCAEKGTVAQNMLTFLGYNSEVVFSPNCRLNEEKGNEAHAYNIVKSEKGTFIYDPTNPVIIMKEDGVVQSTMPAVYPITEVQYESIISGGQVEVDHIDMSLSGHEQKAMMPTKRIYGGPRK